MLQVDYVPPAALGPLTAKSSYTENETLSLNPSIKAANEALAPGFNGIRLCPLAKMWMNRW